MYLDLLLPLRSPHPTLVLGVFGCLKAIVPHVKDSDGGGQELKGSFGIKKEANEVPMTIDRLLQVCNSIFSKFRLNETSDYISSLDL